MKQKINELVYSMLIENTGTHMLDSGGISGRAWQRNQTKSLKDFESEPSVTFELQNDPKDSTDIIYTISVFHYLTKGLELDEVCDEFNELPCKDWDSEIYGVSALQEKWLNKNGYEVCKESFNTYNGDSSLSQVLQGTYVKRDGETNTYVLLQIHGGADVRGGYTNAKMFYVPNDYMPLEDVIGTIDGVKISNRHDSITLLRDDWNDSHEAIPVTEKSVITLELAN